MIRKCVPHEDLENGTVADVWRLAQALPGQDCTSLQAFDSVQVVPVVNLYRMMGNVPHDVFRSLSGVVVRLGRGLAIHSEDPGRSDHTLFSWHAMWPEAGMGRTQGSREALFMVCFVCALLSHVRWNRL